MGLLWIILIVILVLALLGFFSRGVWYGPKTRSFGPPRPRGAATLCARTRVWTTPGSFV